MKRATLTYLLVVVCLSAFAFSTELSYLPQVADGTWAGGSMKTTFIFFNPTDTPVTVTFKLTDDAGQPLQVTIPGFGTDSEFGPVTLNPGETRFYQTSGTGGLRVGAVEVEASTRIGVSAIFSLFDTAGHFITEAGVGSSPPGTDFVIPVDATGQFNTGVAIVVPGAAAAHLTFRLRNLSGSQIGTTTQTLVAGGHMARFAAGPGSLFPQASNLRGSLEISSDQAIAAVVLRQNGAPLTNTTLPVVSTDSTETQFNLSQVANGTDQGFTIRTTFIVFNYASGTANVNFTVRKPDGSPFPVTIPGGVANNASTFTRQLASGAAAFLQTDGTGPLSVGSAQVTSNVPIGVAAIFTLYSGTTFLTEAGVGEAEARTDFTLPVDTTGSFNTGIAVFNPGDTPALVTYRLLDEDGVRVDEVTGVILPGRSQSAKFITEYFAGRAGFRGSLSVSSNVAVAAVTLRQNGSPLSYTTLPVEEGAVQGTGQAVTALLDQTKTAITATSNATVNASLPAGFKISGQVTGALSSLLSVSARSGDTQFSANLDTQSGRYVVVVPAGTYQLTACYVAQSAIPLGVPSLRYTQPTNVVVNADVTRDITIPASALQMVSGAVTGLDQFPQDSVASLMFANSDLSAGVMAFLLPGGAYSASLPNGTYTASLMVVPTGLSQSLLGLFNVGTLTVSGATSANFAAPAVVTLSGAATRAGASGMPANSSLSVLDKTAPIQAVTGCVAQLATSVGALATANGAYSMLVPRNRQLQASVMYPLGTIGFLLFPVGGRDLPALTANRTENFAIPAPPGNVTISGKVSKTGGQGVADVAVGAFSNQLTGVAGQLYFVGGVQTDGSGNYTITVPSGTNYQMSFAPPKPTP